MRGPSTGALERTYLHSAITEGLWCAVVETERLFEAKLSHAIMLSSLYGNPLAKLEEGNDQIHEMYVDALDTLPYIKAASASRPQRDDALIAEWRRVNAEAAARKAEQASEQASAAEAGVPGEAGGRV